MTAKINKIMVIIAIDIGNSRINIGFFEPTAHPEEPIVHYVDTYPLKTASDYEGIIVSALKENHMDKKPGACIISSVVISSVVPGHTAALTEAGRLVTGSEPLIVSAASAGWMRFEVDRPSDLGSDRVAGAVGAFEIFGAPSVVVDAGTATTVNFIGRKGVFKGGAILPGVRLMAEALGGKTSQLPAIKPEGHGKSIALGKNTETAILSGLLYGTSGAVERIIKEVEAMDGERYKVILTGGNSALLRSYLRHDAIEPHLILKGMRRIYLRNA